MVAEVELLGQITCFGDLDRRNLTDIALCFRQDHFQSGHIIFNEGDPATRFWIIKDGQVKMMKYGPDSRESVIEVLSRGEIFGGAAMLMEEHPASAQALSPVATLSMSIEQYHQTLITHPTISIHILKAMGERMRGALRMRMLMNASVERRIVHILLKLSSKCGIPHEDGIMINLRLTRQDIADLADTTIETAIRTMSHLRKEDLIKTLKGGYIVILDAEALAQIAQAHFLPG